MPLLFYAPIFRAVALSSASKPMRGPNCCVLAESVRAYLYAPPGYGDRLGNGTEPTTQSTKAGSISQFAGGCSGGAPRGPAWSAGRRGGGCRCVVGVLCTVRAGMLRVANGRAVAECRRRNRCRDRRGSARSAYWDGKRWLRAPLKRAGRRQPRAIPH
jgi:hypothetical protein